MIWPLDTESESQTKEPLAVPLSTLLQAPSLASWQIPTLVSEKKTRTIRSRFVCFRYGVGNWSGGHGSWGGTAHNENRLFDYHKGRLWDRRINKPIGKYTSISTLPEGRVIKPTKKPTKSTLCPFQPLAPRRRETLLLLVPKFLHPIINFWLRVVVIQGLAYPAVVVNRRPKVAVFVGDSELRSPSM